MNGPINPGIAVGNIIARCLELQTETDRQHEQIKTMRERIIFLEAEERRERMECKTCRHFEKLQEGNGWHEPCASCKKMATDNWESADRIARAEPKGE